MAPAGDKCDGGLDLGMGVPAGTPADLQPLQYHEESVTGYGLTQRAWNAHTQPLQGFKLWGAPQTAHTDAGILSPTSATTAVNGEKSDRKAASSKS